MLEARIAHLELRANLRVACLDCQLLGCPAREFLADPDAENRAGRFVAPLAVESRGNHVGVAVRLNARVRLLVAKTMRSDRPAPMHADPMMLERRYPVQARRHVDQLRAEALPAERFARAQRDARAAVRGRNLSRDRYDGVHRLSRGWQSICGHCAGFFAASLDGRPSSNDHPN